MTGRFQEEIPLPDDDEDDESSPRLRRFASLSEALRETRVPLENHDFVRLLMERVGIDAYFARAEFIKAVRADGKHWVRIQYGFTQYLSAEQEILDSVGDCDRDGWEDGTWHVWHPVNRKRGGDAAGRDIGVRDYGTCPVCFTHFSAAGTCLCL